MIKAASLFVLAGVALGVLTEVRAAPPTRHLPDISLKSVYQEASEPLTTEKAWALDFDELNPHRSRWILNRKVELGGLQAREIEGAPEGARFGVSAEAIVSTVTAFFRPAGAWYRPLAEFPCHEEPASWFGTLEGSRKAAEVAAKEWERTLGERKLKLAAMFQQLNAVSAEVAVKNAQILFQNWLHEVSAIWRSSGRHQAKLAEWQLYRLEAAKTKACAKDGVIPWEKMMEPLAEGELGRAGSPGDEVRLLARAPSKRWDGLFSIRGNVTIAGRKLNGRFLVDSGVGTSVLSPEWLENQGILPAWIEVPGAPPRRIPWGGSLDAPQGGLGPVGKVDQVEIGNFALSLREFALFDTDFFAPPDTASSCCDGVLGTDFLRRYVVELNPGPPAEVRLWPSEHFHLADSTDSQWLEEGMTPAGAPVSACWAQSGDLRLGGVYWDTGREAALDVHVPWQKSARAANAAHSSGLSNQWDVRCGVNPNSPIAQGVPASFPVMDPYENKAILDKVPAVSIGMALLGRGRVFLDFPHGRIWFPAKTSSEVIRENKTGLKLKFEMVKGKFDKRELLVRGLGHNPIVKSLVSRGLKKGMRIIRIDEIDADELDTWEVEQRLAGVYGEQVMLQWKTPKGLRLGALKVR
ncbi:retropepsin-like aspartic protease [Bdellovibrionota bacterium FG-1]